MKTTIRHTNLYSVSWAMLYVSVKELMTSRILTRLAITFVATMGLLYVVSWRGNAAAFWFVVTGPFFAWFLPVMCLTKGGESVRSELKEGTMEYLWTRPVRRGNLFIGLYAASLASVIATVGSVTIGVVAVGILIGAWGSLMTLLGFVACVIVCVFGYTAISALLGAYSARFVVLGVLYFSMIESGIGKIPTGIHNVAISAHVRDVLVPLRYGESTLVWGDFFVGAAWILAIGCVALAAGAALFANTQYFVGSTTESE